MFTTYYKGTLPYYIMIRRTLKILNYEIDIGDLDYRGATDYMIIWDWAYLPISERGYNNGN